jgi:uncharacterized protein CbrC (UPF0167 family)
MNLPEFKYNPNAYSLKIIKKKKGKCECCEKDNGYLYEGPFFCEDDVEDICPWCIKDGSAAKKFEGEFQDSESIEEVKNPAAIEEVIHKTPGYPGMQQEVWLAHCNDLCAFIGYAKPSNIKPILDELLDDIDNSDYAMAEEELYECLQNEEISGYLFKCLHCGTHRIHLDQD